MRRANEAAMKHATLIKQKMFVLETIGDGDAELMSVLIANSGCSCESSSAGEDDEDANMDGEGRSLERPRKGYHL